jgi:hypothetical protein
LIHVLSNASAGLAVRNVATMVARVIMRRMVSPK